MDPDQQNNDLLGMIENDDFLLSSLLDTNDQNALSGFNFFSFDTNFDIANSSTAENSLINSDNLFEESTLDDINSYSPQSDAVKIENDVLEDKLNENSTRRSSRKRRSSDDEPCPSNKKQSNKDAATRYRMKKSTENSKLVETRVSLEQENEQVKKKIELAKTEISYLKNLIIQTILTKKSLSIDA